LSADAMSNACARLSSTHGPAIKASGRALPKRTAYGDDAFGVAVIGVLAATMKAARAGQPARPHFIAEKPVGRRNAL